MKVRVWCTLLVLVAGCAVAGWSAGAGEHTTPGAVASPSNLAPYNLLWYTRGRGPEPDQALVEEAANRYLAPRINATIRIVNLDRSAYATKMAGIVASGEAYDMAFTAGWAGYFQYALKGAFAPLNDPKDNLFDTWMPKTKAVLGRDFLDSAAIDGVVYAVPVEKEHAQSYGFDLRRDIVEKHHMDVSKLRTLDDLEPLLRTVKENEPSVRYPLQVDSRILDWNFLAPGVVSYTRGTDRGVYNALDRPETLRYFDTVRRYFLAGYIRKDAAEITDWVPDVMAGRVFAVPSVTIPGDDRTMENATGLPWVEVNMTQPVVATNAATGAMNAISMMSRDKARAAMFMELMNTDRYLNNLINFGIEGVHWVRVSDTVIDFAPSTNGGRASRYNPQAQWMLGNQRLNYLFPNEDPDKWKLVDAYNRSAVPVNGIGFRADTSDLTSEIGAISNVVTEYGPGLDVGSSDPAVYLPLYRDKLKAVGIDKVIAEVRKQYDAWCKRNPGR